MTQRTFFRHFNDKREVLFEEEALHDALLAAIAKVPPALPPFEALLGAFRSTEQLLEENRSSAELSEKIIAANPALQERQLAKTAMLTNTLAAAMQARGLDRRIADLAARAGMVAFIHAAASWRSDPTEGLGPHLFEAFAELRRLSLDEDVADRSQK